MPELPEVETTVRGLARYLQGERLERVALNRPDMRFPFPDGFVQRLAGARVTGLGRRAKYGLVHIDRALTMVFHLGMSGRWRIDPEALGKHDHLVLETTGHRFALCDPRRFGFVDLVPTDALEHWPPFAAMGPEPLSAELTATHLKAVLGLADFMPDADRVIRVMAEQHRQGVGRAKGPLSDEIAIAIGRAERPCDAADQAGVVDRERRLDLDTIHQGASAPCQRRSRISTASGYVSASGAVST